MKAVSNYKQIACYNDKLGRSTWNKNDLMYLIRKFFVNKYEDKISISELTKKTKAQLYRIWMQNKPKDIFSELV
jgi:hypothetical protein